MFLGERDTESLGSILTDVHYNNCNSSDLDSSSISSSFRSGGLDLDGVPAATGVVDRLAQLTPPDDYPIADRSIMASVMPSNGRPGSLGQVGAWLEIWDYAGGSSFRGFVSQDPEDKTLFVFFDIGILGRDLKKAYVLPSSSLPPDML
jgi:hypothetical protein